MARWHFLPAVQRGSAGRCRVSATSTRLNNVPPLAYRAYLLQGGPKNDTLLVFEFPLVLDALYLHFFYLLTYHFFTIGHRAFPVAGARIWNDLPADVTSAPSLLIFRQRLKLHLFRLSYPGLVLWINCFICVVLVVAACYLGHLKKFLIDWLSWNEVVVCRRKQHFEPARVKPS